MLLCYMNKCQLRLQQVDLCRQALIKLATFKMPPGHMLSQLSRCKHVNGHPLNSAWFCHVLSHFRWHWIYCRRLLQYRDHDTVLHVSLQSVQLSIRMLSWI